MDLYEVLGVRKGASERAIASAFRRRSRETHPDRGGSTEEFALVVLAKDVLLNPERREEYDRTGIVPDVGPDVATSRAIQMMWTAFFAVLDKIQYPTHEDVLAHIRGALGQIRASIETEKRTIEPRAAKLAMCVGRFEMKGEGDNLLEAAVRTQLEQYGKALKRLDERIESCNRAVEMLRGYSFRRDGTIETGWRL